MQFDIYVSVSIYVVVNIDRAVYMMICIYYTSPAASDRNPENISN